VDFDKGCYLGQEIVARAQFRGAVKKQLAEFSWQGVAPVLGDTWQNPQGTKGDVVYVSRNDSDQSNLSGTGLWVTRKAKEDVEQSAS
jgi:folate-binding Fe-S cluster repair protein YgfZ